MLITPRRGNEREADAKNTVDTTLAQSNLAVLHVGKVLTGASAAN